MAGVKGRSGGARPNTGGKRAGAGRKPKIKPVESTNALVPPVPGTTKTPLEFLELVMNDLQAPLKDRIRAAVAAAQYRHGKVGEGGKKNAKQEAAKVVTAGRFGSGAPPRLVVNRK